MRTVQELLNEVDRTYRNSYSVNDKLIWMNATQKQIFQIIPKESIPWEFFTFSDMAFYDLPEDCDRFAIKELSIEQEVDSGKYDILPFISLEATRSLSPQTKFYSVLEQKLMINPIPTVETQGKRVLLLYTHRPLELTLESIPELEEDYHELLVLGTLERIARARGEIDDKNNFAADYNVLFNQYKEIYKVTQPEYFSMNDVLPRSRRRR